MVEKSRYSSSYVKPKVPLGSQTKGDFFEENIRLIFSNALKSNSIFYSYSSIFRYRCQQKNLIYLALFKNDIVSP